MTDARHPGTARRPLLLGALAAVPLSACDALSGDDRPPGRRPAPTRERDQELVEAAITVERRLVRLLEPLQRSGSGADRRRAGAAQRVHLDHLGLLEDSARSAQRAVRLDRRQRLAQQARLVRAEEDASRLHRAAAVKAASGQLARVLAAMSAASAQQAQVWREAT